MSTHYNTSAPEPKLTESEYEQIQGECDVWLIGTVHNTASLHLMECRGLDRTPAPNLTEKSIKAYPYGHYDVCQFCRRAWRDGRLEGINAD